MKKYIVLFISLVFCSIAVSAQYQKATEEQQKEIVGKIKQASGNVNTMKCDFTQVRELTLMDETITQEGKMYYKKENKIRWDYAKPYQYALSMDGKNTNMTSHDKTTSMPVGQRKMFDEVFKVMLISINGMGLVDSSDFDAALFLGSDDFKVILTPKRKEMKAFFSSIQLFASKNENRIRSIELVQKDGEKIIISLKNIQLNTTINDAIFSQ
jgi:outer membrane lipoprotein-sorting protein